MSNKYCLVTGGSRGIGEAIAKTLLDKGHYVIITATTNRSGWWDDYDKCELHVCDFSDKESVKLLMDFISNISIDYLVNNAAVYSEESLNEHSDLNWEKTYDINVFTHVKLISQVASGMQKRSFGRIVNVSSIASFVTRPNVGAYASSKAAISSITRTAALEYAKSNILVNSVCPAYTETDMLNSQSKTAKEQLLAKVPLNKFCQPQDVAEMVYFLLSDKNNFITGQNINLDGGVTIQ